MVSVTDFFIEPCKIIKRELEKMRDTEKLTFCCLAMCVMGNNKFDLIQDNIATLRRICDARNIDFNTKSIRPCLDNFVGTFLKRSYVGSMTRVPYYYEYKFYSDSLFIVVAHYYLEHLFDFVLTEGSSDFIASRFRLLSSVKENDNKYFVVPSEKEEMYFQKLLDDLIGGNPFTSFRNKNLRNHSYVEKFHRYFLNHGNVVKKAISELTSEAKHPFHIIAENDFCLAIPLLLELNQDINIKNKFGDTPISVALHLKKYCMINMLLRNGAHSSICSKSVRSSIKNADIMPLLCVAAEEGQIDIVKCLIENKTDLNITSTPLKQTALFLAASSGHNEIVELLINSNCDPNIFDSNNFTPLYGACKGNYIDVVMILLGNNANPNTRVISYRQKHSYQLYDKYGREKESFVGFHVKRIRVRCPEDGNTPLLNAIHHGNVQMVELLLKHHADPNMCNRYHVSPLHAAIAFRKKLPWSNYDDNYLNIAKVLLEKGANPNTFDVDCTSPLSTAVDNKDNEAIKILLQHGAVTNFDNRFRRYAPYIFQENLPLKTRVLDILDLKRFSCVNIFCDALCCVNCSHLCCRCKQKPILTAVVDVPLIERM